MAPEKQIAFSVINPERHDVCFDAVGGEQLERHQESNCLVQRLVWLESQSRRLYKIDKTLTCMAINYSLNLYEAFI